MATDPFHDGSNLVWLGLADALAVTIAVVSLVQSDGPGNPLGDWRIRPVGWSSVLLAKVVALGVIIVLPRLLLGTAMAGLFQQTLREAAMATGLRLVVDLMILGLAIGLATATRNAAQAAIAAGLFLATWLLVLLWMDEWSRFQPHGLVMGFASLSVAAVAVSVALYRGRKSARLRWGLAVGGLIWAPLTIGIMPAIEMTRQLPERRETAATHQVSLQLAAFNQDFLQRADFTPLYPSDDDDISGLYIGYIQRRPDDIRLDETMTRVFRVDGSTESQLTGQPSFWDNGSPNTEGVVAVGTAIGRIGRTESMRIEFDYTVYRRRLLRPLPPSDGGLHSVPGIGSCEHQREDRRSARVACLSLVRPNCLSVVEVRLCGSQGWLADWFRWPSPYATQSVSFDPPDAPGLSTWTTEGWITREITLTRRELDTLAKPLSPEQRARFLPPV